jgi:hypothetical protein
MKYTKTKTVLRRKYSKEDFNYCLEYSRMFVSLNIEHPIIFCFDDMGVIKYSEQNISPISSIMMINFNYKY